MLSNRYIKKITKNTINITLIGLISFQSPAFGHINLENKLVINNNKGTKTIYKREGSLALPIIKDHKHILFVDMRGNFDNNNNYGGSIGLGARKDVGYSDILGVYGFYDYLSSSMNNNFHQVTAGIELLSKNWETRLNSYVPVSQYEHGNSLKKFISSRSQPTVSTDESGNMFMSGKFSEEVALKGFEGEFGRKVKNKLGLYVGGYYFYRDGYEDIIGPRLRLTLSEKFAESNEIGLSAAVQNDDVRGTQLGLSFNIRVPLGEAQNKIKDNDLLTTKIQREIGIMTAGKDEEVNPSVGIMLNKNTYYKTKVLSADNDIVNEIANNTDENELIILDGEKGDISASSTIIMKKGQALISGDRNVFNFAVDGITFNSKLHQYKPAKIVAADGFPADTNLVTLAERNTIQGIEFDGVKLSTATLAVANVLYGSNANNLLLDSNIMRTFEVGTPNPNVCGITLNNISNSTISNSTIVNNAHAIHITGNKASNNNILNNNIEVLNGIGINHYYTGVEYSNIVGNNITAATGIRFKIEKDFNKNIISENTITSTGHGIVYDTKHSQITNNIISKNTITSSTGKGITYNTIGSDTNNTSVTSNNTISENVINSSGQGIYHYSEYSPITNNIISKNAITSGGKGMYYHLYDYSHFTGNNIAENKIETTGQTNHGIFIENPHLLTSGSSIISNNINANEINTASSDAIGIYFYSFAGIESIENNLVRNNIIRTQGNNATGIVYVADGGGITVQNNIQDANTIITSGTNAHGVLISKQKTAAIIQNNGIKNNDISISGNADALHFIKTQNNLVKNNKFTLNSNEALAIGFAGTENTVNQDSIDNNYEITGNIPKEDVVVCEGVTADGSQVEFKDGSSCPADAK